MNREELPKIRESYRARKPAAAVVSVGMATCGIAAGARETMDALGREIREKNLRGVSLKETGCLGYCFAEPLVEVKKDGKSVLYKNVRPKDAAEIVREHLQGGREVGRLKAERRESRQIRVALENCGVINPEDINEYISVGGYSALDKALFEMTPQKIIDEIKASGLRGRGGAGFPTGLKWEACAASPGGEKYVICNADEGDPGAFMDRSILEGDPHCVLEAMAICGRAAGASNGVIYIRAEYPLAVKRIKDAIAVAEKHNLSGKNILNSGFDFSLKISLGAGAFVCGEETALMNSIEGKRGEPRVKPPFPAQKGLKNRPSNINNVETYANVPRIIAKGADWFRSIGTKDSPGTKVFALAGRVNNVGLIETPMGLPLRVIVEEIGGGVKDGKKFKAAQIGGPSGGCLPARLLDTPVDFENLAKAGCPMGSGGMIIIDEDGCMVDMAKYFLEFTAEESCGKCTPCRVGNRRMLEILRRITNGEGEPGDIEKLENLGNIIKDTALCGLGQGSPNPVLSMLKNFREEYAAHFEKKYCPAGVCEGMRKYAILPEKCISCGICAKICPVNCISGAPKIPYKIDRARCVKCGACREKCPADAINN
jgi:NADH:ubiquinone oxidoreductase subunit F (NADH-binding)/Pyruvate/2-oxoacid:ferredoxin oxidoreductase delta subunit